MTAGRAPAPERAPNYENPQMRGNYWRDPILWLLVVLAFVVRVAYNLALHPDGHPPSHFVIDETEYFGAAHMLAEGRGFSFFDTSLWVRPPLYVSSLACVMSVGGDSYVPSLLFQSALSALTLPALGWLAYRVAGMRAARWSLALALLYLPLTLFAGLLLSETLFVLLFSWALVTLVAAREAVVEGTKGNTWTVLALAGSGLLLGLCVLTRSTALGFVPLAGLWLLWPRSVNLKRRALASAVVIGICVLALVPWIARNYSEYGRFIPVDTTGGYNLWLGSIGVRDEPRLQADLLAIPNPGDRQSYAYSQAFQTIAADPPGFVGKGLKEAFDLWLPSFSAEERQVRGYALGRVPAWHLLSLLLFDDLLYIIILLLSVVGLALAPAHALKGLTGLWVALWVLMSFVFFAVTRFRLPIVACLIPWAGVGFAQLPSALERLRAVPKGVKAASGAALIAILLLAATSIPLEDSFLGMERWSQQEPYRAAEANLQSDTPEQLIEKYSRANTELSDTRFSLAAALLRAGRPDEALSLLRPTDDPDRFEPAVLRGEAARRAGNLDDARSFFNARVVQVAAGDALDWAWLHLSPEPVTTVEIGSGLDMGYVRGFYGPERDESGRTFRWTGPHAEIRSLSLSTGYTLSVNGWRPAGAPTSHLSIRSGSPEVTPPAEVVSGQNVWADIEIATDLTDIIALDARPFVPGGSDPRLLGLRASIISPAGNP